MIKLGLIGAGMIAGINTKAILNYDIEVKAAANRTVRRAAELLDSLGIKGAQIYEDYEEMLEKEDLDAVMIMLSHDLHLDAFLASAAKGLDVIIEKPLAKNYKECVLMQKAAKKSGIKSCVCHTERYSPCLAAARNLIDTMDFGKIYHIDDVRSIFYYHNKRASWMLSKELSGNGPVLNYGVHQFDRVYFLKGSLPNPAKLYAKLSYNIPEQECASGYYITGSDNDQFTYNISFSGYSGPSMSEINVFCENGVIRIMIGKGLRNSVSYSIDNKPFKDAELPYDYDVSKIYKKQFESIADYLHGKENNTVNIEWASQMVRMIDFANESSTKEIVVKNFGQRRGR